ncbi:MAG: helicase [Phycisphaerales bacterium]|nr:helicase [Phycisphaerales bacterium]
MPDAIESIFSPGGVLSSKLGDHFEPRAQQRDMAMAVAKAFRERSHLLVEAGTGVGKSFAYLIPAIKRCIEHNEIVVIATNTIALQEQLITKDIPLLAGLLDPDLPGDDDPSAEPRPRLRPVLVKGRGNYVSVRRLKLASERQVKLLGDPAARRSLHVIEDWAYETKDGTLSTLPPLERPGVWDKVQSDSGNCMGRRCPTYDKCFYQSARRTMEQANLLVCNHALYFSDLALRSQDVGFLPQYHHVVLDEAHNVEDVSSEHFGISLAEGRVMHLLTTLYHPRTGRGYLPQLQLLSKDSAPVERAIRLVSDASDATRAFFESLIAESLKDAPTSERFSSGPRTTRLRRAAFVPNILSPAMRDLSLRLKALKESATGDADRFELNAYAIRAQLVADECDALVDQAMPGSAYWIEVGGNDDEGARYQKITLACAPIEVAPILKERLFSREHSVVLTSATLSTARGEGAFEHAMKRLGCDGAATLQLGSPFDYARQAKLIVDRSLPSPKAHGHTDALARSVLHHVLETDGGAFVLFTSFATLNALARRLRDQLSQRGITLLAQGLDGSRQAILERFRGEPRAVLFGAASFWQGVDVRGDALRNVIITKLPFEPPDRPLTQARVELIESRGGDAFREDSLPRAVIRFKQGFGRLIRSASDTGRVVVLDPRIATSGYGRSFLAALPKDVPVVEFPEPDSYDPPFEPA